MVAGRVLAVNDEMLEDALLVFVLVGGYVNVFVLPTMFSPESPLVGALRDHRRGDRREAEGTGVRPVGAVRPVRRKRSANRRTRTVCGRERGGWQWRVPSGWSSREGYGFSSAFCISE